MDDTDARNRCFDHVNVLYMMSNHAQTILHEISLLDEPTDTLKQKFTVQKMPLRPGEGVVWWANRGLLIMCCFCVWYLWRVVCELVHDNVFCVRE